MKRNYAMTLVALILVFSMALAACGSDKAPETTAATVATAAATTAAAPAETAAASQPLALTEWSMSASTWSSPNGATIHINATPNHYAEGQKADFVVRLESDDIAVVPCQWDGSAYTASADLNAANGYGYYVILTAADGTATEVAVNTPDAPTDESFINIEASLESYCSVYIEESSVDNNKLVLTSGKVQVRVPVITNEGEAITCQEAALVLTLDEEELGKNILTLTQTDTPGLYEVALDNVTFDIPDLENGQKADLTLNATLTNGQVLSAYGGNWQSSGEDLLPVVG